MSRSLTVAVFLACIVWAAPAVAQIEEVTIIIDGMT